MISVCSGRPQSSVELRREIGARLSFDGKGEVGGRIHPNG